MFAKKAINRKHDIGMTKFKLTVFAKQDGPNKFGVKHKADDSLCVPGSNLSNFFHHNPINRKDQDQDDSSLCCLLRVALSYDEQFYEIGITYVKHGITPKNVFWAFEGIIWPV